jgi:ribose transport system substrate-binding protein
MSLRTLQRGRTRALRLQCSGVVATATIAAIALGGCGSSTHTTSSTSSHKSGTPTASGSTAGIAAAKAATAPYVGHPSAFPALPALKKLPPAGTKLTYIEAAIPQAVGIGKDLVDPAKALGVTLNVVHSQTAPAALQSAASTVATQKPGALLLSAVAPQFFGGDLHKVVAGGTHTIGVAMTNAAPYGVQIVVGNNHASIVSGKLMADWVAARLGTKANVVFYGTPELSFSPYMQMGFKQGMAKACPSCQVAYQPISVTTFESTAPATVVSYLQAHPTVNTVVFASEEGMDGLPAALKDAGLNHITTMGFAPDQIGTKDIEDGGLTGGLAVDFNVQSWEMVDVAARLIAHQPITSKELFGAPVEFITKGTHVNDDPSGQWTGYPDVAQRFAKIWHR